MYYIIQMHAKGKINNFYIHRIRISLWVNLIFERKSVTFLEFLELCMKRIASFSQVVCIVTKQKYRGSALIQGLYFSGPAIPLCPINCSISIRMLGLQTWRKNQH
jgi:hypothetical protein